MPTTLRVRRVFAIDTEICPYFGGTLPVIACIKEAWQIVHPRSMPPITV